MKGLATHNNNYESWLAGEQKLAVIFFMLCAAMAFATRAIAGDAPPVISQLKAPVDAPNVVVVLLDDVGFGSTSTFGGPVQTPVLEALAVQGLRYNRFHTTAICSPTRASLLTGRDSHAVNVGAVLNS